MATQVTQPPSELIKLHKEDIKKIEAIKAEVGQPNDTNLTNPLPLYEQLTTAMA
jgi:hypothetical protein